MDFGIEAGLECLRVESACVDDEKTQSPPLVFEGFAHDSPVGGCLVLEDDLSVSCDGVNFFFRFISEEDIPAAIIEMSVDLKSTSLAKILAILILKPQSNGTD